MRSPADMEFIQIDITNACNMRCSNCTRFCGNHEKTFFMNYETFKRAIDSMEGFEGVTGIIGGEPTLHPEFERFAEYIREKFGKPSGGDALYYPQKDFIHNIHKREFESAILRERKDGSRYLKKHGAGIWSNMSLGYRKNYEIIQDTFSVEYLNDHLNPSYHQPGLFARKDLMIPDTEWVDLRDKCWIQNTWSATITPKGAFFCEVAASLDMLFDGPGGWPIEPGWWKRRPEDFKDQLHWCEICGFALEGKTFTRDSQEEIDDVSPTVYDMLKKVNSPKMREGKINPVKITDGVIDDSSRPDDKRFVVGNRYIARYEDRFQEKNSILFDMDYYEMEIEDSDNFGQLLNKFIKSVKSNNNQLIGLEWILIKKRDAMNVNKLLDMVGKMVFNPGTLHIGDGYLFFCKAAKSLKVIGYDRISQMKSSGDLIEAWNPEKIVNLEDTDKKTSLNRNKIENGKRYAIWGAGMLGETLSQMVGLSGGEVSLVVDRSTDKIGKPFANVLISNIDTLISEKENYDFLIVAHHLQFENIAREALDMGIEKDKIILPYEV